MDERGKKIIKKTLKEKKSDEKFYKALSRVLSDELEGERGYSLYLDLIREIRQWARDQGVSVVEGAKMIVKEK